MKVQRCPSCGARYNVERLPSGATFECRRCQATVEVASAGGADVSVSLGLLAAGILTLGGLFLYATTRTEAGWLWPWDRYQSAPSLGERVNLVLWAMLGVGAVVVALLPGVRRRSLVPLAFGSLALMLASAPGAYGFVIAVPRVLPWMAGVILLAAGFSLVVHDRFQFATRALLLAGAVLLIWLDLGRFGEPTSRLITLGEDVRQLLAGTLSAEKAGTVHLWGSLAPTVAVLLAAALALVLGLGVRLRFLAGLGALLLFAGMLLPAATRVGLDLEGQAFSLSALGSALVDGLSAALVKDGVALWLVLAAAAADLVRTTEVPS